MKQPDRTPPLTARAKAARRRDRIAGICLFLVALVAVAVTAYAWWMRAQGG